jgi:pimeloyl-ACP methyl ester carboxylesterase
MAERKGHSAHVLGALGLLALAAAACGGGSTALGVPTTTVPTTTLPVVRGVVGSAVGGAYSALGPVKRVSVLSVAPGRVAPRLLADGTMGARSLNVAFRRFGSGPNLLLITGEHGSLTSWDPQALLDLAASYRVTVFDLPSIGYSQSSTRANSVPSLADLTAGLIWSLGLSRPTVLGWGFGGEIAMSLVERHPGLVWRLVLVDAMPGGSASVRPGAAVAKALASPLATTAEISRLFFPAHAQAARASWLADVEQLSSDDLTAPAIEAQSSLISRSYRDDAVTRGLRKIEIPTLILAGADDEVVPVANSYELARRIVHSQLIVFPGAGYASIFQNASDFVVDLTTFTDS